MTPQEAINAGWTAACLANEIEPDDVFRFDHDGRTFALYRTADDKYYATDGMCTHARVHLAGGLVMDNLIECPKHNGRFDFTTGKAQGAPVCVDLKTYETKIEDGRLFLRIS